MANGVGKLTEQQLTTNVVQLGWDTLAGPERAKFEKHQKESDESYQKMKTIRERLTRPAPYTPKERKKLITDLTQEEKKLQKSTENANKAAENISLLTKDSAKLAKDLFASLLPIQAKSVVNNATGPTYVLNEEIISKGFLKPVVNTMKVAWRVFRIIAKNFAKELWGMLRADLEKAIKKELKEIKGVAKNEINRITEHVIGLLVNSGQYAG